MKKKTILVMVMALGISLLVGCTVSHGTSKNSIEKDNSHRISATYDKFDGYKKTTLKLDKDEKKDVKVDIVSKKGEINLSIKNEDGTVAYEGKDMDTTTFTVTLDKEGKYTIRIDAKEHYGSYDINW